MRKHFTALVLLAACALPVASEAAENDSRHWQSAAPEAVRREVCERALEGGPVRVLLDDGRELAGTVEDVGPATFTLEAAPAAGAVEISFAEVRGLAWERRSPSRAAKAKAAAARFAGDPASQVDVHLRNRQVVKGHIREAGDLTFVVVEKAGGAERTIGYRAVERIPKPPKQVFEEVGTYSLLVLMLPLFLLGAMLTGWDGC